MSRRESDRENLLREATALVERVELKIANYSEPVVVGFRRDGSASFYFGNDPVYQFNTNGELRRAYVDGLLYKAERSRLVSLRRERTGAEVALVRAELSSEAAQTLLQALQDNLRRLQQALAGGSLDLVGQVSSGSDVLGRIRTWLAALPESIPIARAAGVR